MGIYIWKWDSGMLRKGLSSADSLSPLFKPNIYFLLSIFTGF
jgi:hypothetical protein